MKKISHFLLNLIAQFVLEPRFESGRWQIKSGVLGKLKWTVDARGDVFDEAEKLFAETGTCEGCHASCCHGAFNRFTVYDHISHLVAEVEDRPGWGYKLKPSGAYELNRQDEGQCEHYEKGAGCRLEHNLRPAQCIWYSCGEIDQMLSRQQKGELVELRKRLDRIFWAYARALLFGGMEEARRCGGGPPRSQEQRTTNNEQSTEQSE